MLITRVKSKRMPHWCEWKWS